MCENVGWLIVLSSLLASCISLSNSQGSPDTLQLVEEQTTVVEQSEKSVLVGEKDALQGSLSSVSQGKNDDGVVDPDVAALREEALESAIADGNITPLTTNCRMGICVESYYTFTTLMRQVGSELLYSTELVTFQVKMDASEPGRWSFQPAETLVLCSTQRPLVIYSENDQYRLDHISPGNYPPGFGLESHGLYWAICHNVETVLELSAQAMAEKASQLGYDPTLEAGQTTTPFLELFEE